MGEEERAALRDRPPAGQAQAGEAPHLGYRHARAAHPFEEDQLLHVVGLVPADGVHAAAGSPGQTPDMETVGRHAAKGSSTASARAESRYSRSSTILPSLISITKQ